MVNRNSRRLARPTQDGSTAQPDALIGCWGEVAAAARLNDLSEVQILQAVLDRRVRSEKRGGVLTVALDDVARLKVQGGTTA
jgi:hypothetical protein